MKRTATILLVIVLTLFTVCPCVLAQTVPFHEGFDDGVLPTGWTIIDSDGDGYCWDVLSGPSYGHSGDGLIISGSYTGVNNWLVSPAITIPQNAILSFWIRGINADYAAEEYSVYVATSNTDTAFISTVPVLTDTTISVWEQKLIDLSLYAGQTVYIAFRHHNTTRMYYLGLDEVEVTSCLRATSLNIEDVSGTSAMVRWQHNGLNEPDHYELSYKVENDSTWVIVSPIHSNNYLLDNLSPTTGYLVRLRVFCDDTTASDYLENSFITDCICCPPSSLDVSDISGTAAMVTWQSIGSNDPDHYELSYKVEDDSAWTIVSHIYTNYYLLTNLSPTTKYNVKVRLFCDDTTSSNWLERTFRTECLDGTSDLIIGKTNTSNQGNYFPIGFDDNYSYTQQIYHSDEIGEARPINAIDIQYFYGTPESRTVDIYLGHTQQTGFTSGYDWVPITDLILVYSGSVMFDNTGDNYWCHIPFNTTFEYNGIDNLVLACYDNTGSSNNSWYERCYTHSTPTSFSKRVSSYEALDLANISFHYGYIPSYRNNIRFPGICVNNACERPLVSAVNITDSSAQLTVSSANSADGFELEYRQEGSVFYSAISATSTSILLTGLRQNTQYDVRVRSICDGNYSSWKKTTFTTGAGNHNRLYVTASGTGDGTSWTDAANDLQWALNTAEVIKNTYSTTPEIWVAAGTYFGDTSATSQNAFTMVEGVNVYGGFAGNEPADYDLSLRDFGTNTTILDGQNARQVLNQPSSFSTTTLWDGFTIQHGYVDSYSGGGGSLLRRNGCLSHCVVKNNYAGGGGGIYASYGTITNCLVSNNTAANTGGGIDAWNSTITNTTIVRNTSSYEGAGFWGDHETQFMNNIVWGNGTSPSKNVAGDFVCSYSAIEGGWNGTGNVVLYDFNPPLFVNPSVISGYPNGTENDDWHLQEGSPCINRGDNTAATNSYDLDGTTRIKRDTVDMGCFESDYYSSPINGPEYTGIVYVTQEGAGAQTGEDWANATSSISFALSMAHAYQADVWVATGTYYGDTSSTSQNAFTMMKGVNVYGGFAGNESVDYDLSLRDFGANATILDGQNARRVLYQPSYFNTETTWDGFTIQHGSSNNNGGGANLNSNGKLSNSIIKNNTATSYGGGIYAGSSSVVSNCLISNNTAYCGGGTYAYSSTIYNCNISNNTSSYGGGVNAERDANVSNCFISNNFAYSGGGVYAFYNSTISGCHISNNIGNIGGGGIYIGGSSIVANCLISNNSTATSGGGYGGGGIYLSSSSVTITNTTIVRNSDSSLDQGAGISVSWGTIGYITNCIVWGNGIEMSHNILNPNGNLSISHSAIEGGYSGENNIALSDVNPPLFVNPSLTSGVPDSTENVDWHLQEGSPCINVGNNAFVTESIDLDGTTRIKNDVVDLGCYESEYGGNTPCTGVVSEFWHSACDSYTWNDQTYTQSGDYEQVFALSNGCDSIVTLHLTVTSTDHTDFTDVACDSYTWNGETYTESGTYSQTFTNLVGCDSMVTLHLTITNTDYTDFTDAACDSYTWNGETYTESGTYSQTFTNSVSCDSVVTLYLTVNNSTTDIDEQTACESFTWINGVTYTESTNTPTFTLTNAAGCDSIVTLNLTINSAYHEYLHVSACEEYVWNGETYSASGDYNQTFTAANGCDSIVTLHLTINNPVHTAVTEVACESFFWNDITYTQSGDYTQTFTAANGCDSVVTLHLTITNTDHTDFTDAACDSYTWNGETYAQSGTYSQTFTNSVGCDSVVTLHLTITNTDHTDFTDEACNSYTWNSETYTQSGDYTQTFTNSAGCDSVVTLHLTINQPTTGDTTAVACESFTWEGETYMQSGDYTSYQTNAAGCDSIVTLHLTVNYPVHTAIAAGSCGSYLWNGNTYNESGDYTFSHEDANGCTQVDTLYLTIFDNETSEFSVECPDSCYTWNSQSYCASGDYTQTLQTVHGCDSVVTLHLTITVSVDDYDGFDFKVYPNPTSNIVNVQCTMNNVQFGGMELHLCDAYGRLLDVFRANNDSPLRTAQIDLSRYAKGVYFVKAVADGTTAAVRKVVKQ